jgi:phage terminase large subunit-like protein
MSVSTPRRPAPAPTLDDIRTELAGRSLRHFVRQAWHVVEPATPYVSGWHLDVICEHLEAVTRGDLRNLIINVPPRHMKSLAVSVFWPCWEWVTHPERRWLFASYAQSLSTRDSLKCRRLIQHPWYQERWGHVYQLAGDQNAKMRFENDRTGYRIATSVGGIGTGEGGDRVVVDDPHNTTEAESDAIRAATLDWWDVAMSTRGNDPKTVARVIVMQRVHENDLTGHVLEKAARGGQQYDHLVLPARYEPRAQVCGADLVHDPRSEPEGLLWPERFADEELRALEVDLGEDAPGQLQQRPTKAGGAIFKREWWADGRNRYDPDDSSLAAQVIGRWLSYDTAMKDKDTSDFTARVVVELLADYRLLVRDIHLERLQFPDLVGLIEADATRWNHDGKLKGIVIEDKNSGTSAGQSLTKGTLPWLSDLVVMFTPLGSKEYRAKQASLWSARDCILFPHPSDSVPWLFDFLGPEPKGRLFKFPRIEHDDDVDTFDQIVIYLENFLSEGWHGRKARPAA